MPPSAIPYYWFEYMYGVLDHRYHLKSPTEKRMSYLPDNDAPSMVLPLDRPSLFFFVQMKTSIDLGVLTKLAEHENDHLDVSTTFQHSTQLQHHHYKSQMASVDYSGQRYVLTF